ncbi:AI-2E family transporter [Lederbergia lenta]|uniref:Putative autoinducer -2 export protein AI-2E n=1 Tax=Lederbergia lenta TaxID=1467 RepID=A0A2X4W3V4_LEDLE|nr:AI-2E family transporter [Lederbergia lenta]MCM3109443.1 AI-2E family transporter [Lederbergia lenta]MEC2324792.1 AI-2E family transporter [Lederbergia lenta]SQI57743.1 putative autoinducer -2 export protein AI-2E [Lederbergia lenta]
MQKEKWFKFGVAIIMIFLIIWLGTKISFIFTPLVVIITTLFPPIILAGVLYYLMRPIVNFLSKKIPRTLAILITFIAIGGIITGLVFLIGPKLQMQFDNLIKNFPGYAQILQDKLTSLSQNEWFQQIQNDYLSIDKLTAKFEENAQSMFQNIASTIAETVGFIANIVMVLVLIPFVLFFMLKDGKQAPKFLMKILPKKHQVEAEKILVEMDEALSSYIQGQLIVSFCVGLLAYIGYLIIGLEYSLVLGVLAMVTNVIPFVGPWIGTFPAIIVGLLTSPLQALLVAIVAVVAQQTESNFISPLVMGKALNMHPLTIIFVLLVAGQFAGLLGLILAVPTYALLKVIVSHLYRYIKLE